MSGRRWRERKVQRAMCGVGAVLAVLASYGSAYADNELGFLVGALVALVLLVAAFPSPATPCLIGATVCAFIAWANNWEWASVIPSVLCIGFLAAAVLVTRRSVRRGRPTAG